MGFVIAVLWVLFVVAMLLLMGVILLQEGKGGGLAEAFGGAGAETFGVKAGGINRFTAILATAFLVLAILINVSTRFQQNRTLVEGSGGGETDVLAPGVIPEGGGGPVPPEEGG